jgi:glycosyltransferase involved in cell wall biosynthesis
MDAPRKILFLTYGAWMHASSRTRAILYFDRLRETGNYRISWIPRVYDRKKGRIAKLLFAFCKRFLAVRKFLSIVFLTYDLVYIQRAFTSPFLLKVLRWKNTKVIFDFDDAIYLNHAKAPHNFRNTVNLIRVASHVIVSSPVLEDFCRENGNQKVSAIPTPIETERFLPKKHEKRERTVIGWIGSSHTSHYLQTIAPALKEVFAQCSVQFVFVGLGSTFSIENLPFEGYNWSYETETDLISKMDIGIMPLTNDDFSTGKGGYKLYQYMAGGIPVVASPVGMNAEIVLPGKNGFLASSHSEWVECLKILADDCNLRNEMGTFGRKMAEEKFGRTVCTKTLVDIFDRTLRE